MASDSVINAVAREYAGFALDDIEDEAADVYEEYCGFGRVFKKWTEEMLDVYIGDKPDPRKLAEAKVLLVDRTFAWRESVPKSHRNHTGEQGHKCIYHVFVDTYQKIRLVELTLTPTQLFSPPAPPPTPPPTLGITLGEIMGDVE